MRGKAAFRVVTLIALGLFGSQGAASQTVVLQSPSPEPAAAKKPPARKGKRGALAQPAPAKPSLGDFDSYVAATMKEWKVPGLAIAVVQDGKVILSKGYGYRDVQQALPVTPKTLFAIGSITKSFTVTALGILADEGKLDWDKPVREYLPGFRLYDEVASERLTPRDMVTHRSGLPRHDALWYNSPFTRKEMVERLRYLEPSKDIRTTYQYNNLMFMTAGYLAGVLGGTTWEESVQRRIFDPLGMASTNFSVVASQKSADFALPYVKVKEEVKGIPFRVIDEVGPAGSINSNLEDMTRYLILHMSRGKFEGKQILSENNALQMQQPQMVVPGPLRWPELGHSAYGMAWVIAGYRGHKMVQHGGGIDGFIALLTFLPQDNLGVVALSNRGGQPLPTILTYSILDRLLGAEPAPWSQRLLDDQKKQEAAEEEAKKKGFTIRRAGTRPSHELAEYIGEYDHPAYGLARVELENNELRLTFNRIVSPLRHFHYEVFEVPEDPLNPLEKRKITFTTNIRGDVESLAILLEPNVKEIVFTRLPEKTMRQRGFLEPFTGQYVVGPQTVTLSLKGNDTLVLVVPGQPERELLPTRGLSFDVKGLSGFSIEFKKDAGAVTEIVFYQPNGTFVGKKKP